MFSFWGRKGNKSPLAGRSTNANAQPNVTIEPSDKFVQAYPDPRTTAYPPSPVSQDSDQAPPPQASPPPKPIVAAAPNPHEEAIFEVEAKIAEAERLASLDTKGTGQSTHDSSPELLQDPATGAQRGIFETEICVGVDSDKVRDEVWSHLAKMRELQSEIAKMHMDMEGLGEGRGSITLDVDPDIDIDTVPTQEEEDAAKRQREFERLPEKFKGRADDISTMMAKLDELSQAITAFHALQPPPLGSESNAGSGQNTHDSNVPPSSRTKPSGSKFSPITVPEQKFTDILHDSPVSHHHILGPSHR